MHSNVVGRSAERSYCTDQVQQPPAQLDSGLLSAYDERGDLPSPHITDAKARLE